MQGIFQKENTDKALKYGIYRHLPTYEKIIRNLVSFLVKKLDKKYNRIAIADYEEPFILHFGHVCRIESNFFTEIMKFENEEFDDLQMNALIEIDTGEKLIWIKPYKKRHIIQQ